MRLLVLTSFILSACSHLPAQDIDKIINPAEVEKIEKILSADDMQGRASFSPGIEKAADFIEAQFRAAGLQTWDNGNSYRQPFSLIRAKTISVTGTFDGQPVDSSSITVFSSDPQVQIDEHSGYEKSYIRAGENFTAAARGYISQGGKEPDYLVLVDTSFPNVPPFPPGLENFKHPAVQI